MLKKVKDIVYDINDVIVVLVILALAALLIWSRLEVIMAYPTVGDEGVMVSSSEPVDTGGSDADGAVTHVQGGEAGGAESGADGGASLDTPGPTDAGDGASAATDGGAVTGQDALGQTSGAVGSGEPAATDEYPYAMYINYGETAAQIAQKLLEGGIIKDKNDFYDALIAAKAETKLLAGQFIIPQRSTPADIVRILTGG